MPLSTRESLAELLFLGPRNGQGCDTMSVLALPIWQFCAYGSAASQLPVEACCDYHPRFSKSRDAIPVASAAGSVR